MVQGPSVHIRECNGSDPIALEGLTDSDELVPCVRLGEPVLGEHSWVVEEVLALHEHGHAVCSALILEERHGVRQEAIPPPVLFELLCEVHDLAAASELPQPLGRPYEEDVRRIPGSHLRTDGHLIGIGLSVGYLDVDVGVQPLELLDDLLERRPPRQIYPHGREPYHGSCGGRKAPAGLGGRTSAGARSYSGGDQDRRGKQYCTGDA